MEATANECYVAYAFQGKQVVQWRDGKRQACEPKELEALRKDPSNKFVDTNTFLQLISRPFQSKGAKISELAIEALTNRCEKYEDRIKALEAAIAKLTK